MEQAKIGDVVLVHYTGSLEDGTVFDSSREREPIRFTVGDHHIILGFEEAVVGMSPGEVKTEHIPIERGYGPRRDDMIIEIDRSRLPEELEPVVGEPLQIRSQDGRVAPAVITEVAEDTIKIDANHPLAGLNLVFEIELMQIA